MDHELYPDLHHGTYSKTVFGFWVYLLTDFMFFAVLFATYAVLRNSTYGGPSAADLFDLPCTLLQTLILLTSGLTSGVGGIFAHRGSKWGVITGFGLTFVLGMIFLSMEWVEFSHLLALGHSWKQSAFLSAFFTLVATHGLHVIFALLWIPIFLVPVWRHGVTPVAIRRLTCLRMFWQFIGVLWIFIFTIVYLMGAHPE